MITSLLSPRPAPDDPSSDPDDVFPATPRLWLRRARRAALCFAAIIACGNIVIFAASVLAKLTTDPSSLGASDDVQRIQNFEAVDAKLWRGGAPSSDDLRALADAGVTTIIDLRAERDLSVPGSLLRELGLTRVTIPIRDGQTPRASQVERFLDAVDTSVGKVFLHCGAGVGRAGTLSAVYAVSRGGDGWNALRNNLAVGPPSLEQLAFAASLDTDEGYQRPNGAVVALSRTLDAPRRIWKTLESL